MWMGGVAGHVRTHREIKEGLDVKVVRGKDEIEEGLVANLHKLSVPLLCTRGRQVGVEPTSRACACCTPRGTCAPPHPPNCVPTDTARTRSGLKGCFTRTHSHTRAAGRVTLALPFI